METSMKSQYRNPKQARNPKSQILKDIFVIWNFMLRICLGFRYCDLEFPVQKTKSFEQGLVAFLTIIIVSAAALIMALNASFLGLGELDLGYTASEGGTAFYIADGCMEEALERIRKDTAYGVGAGTINLTVSNGSCTIVVADSGSTRTVTVVGTKGNFNKKIEIDLTLTGNVITIDGWEEKDD
jgi:hypothetical protein